MRDSFIKKFTMMLGATTAMMALTTTPSQADDTAILNQIAQNTAGILSAVNSVPTYISQMAQYIANMQQTDTSKSTQTMQSSFATTGATIVSDATAQLALEAQLNAALLPGASASTLPNANDLVYSTLLGQPMLTPDPRNKPGAPPAANPALNYIMNAGGLNTQHAMPQAGWHGTQYAYQRYANYYGTIMAAESFNGYVLANQYVESQNGNSLSQAQMSLVTQASSSDWIANIASEEMGMVFRQLLMFESQMYVLITQLLQTQKQLLVAQAMTNALLIATNQINEGIMASQAQGQPVHA